MHYMRHACRKTNLLVSLYIGITWSSAHIQDLTGWIRVQRKPAISQDAFIGNTHRKFSWRIGCLQPNMSFKMKEIMFGSLHNILWSISSTLHMLHVMYISFRLKYVGRGLERALMAWPYVYTPWHANWLRRHWYSTNCTYNVQVRNISTCSDLRYDLFSDQIAGL